MSKSLLKSIVKILVFVSLGASPALAKTMKFQCHFRNKSIPVSVDLEGKIIDVNSMTYVISRVTDNYITAVKDMGADPIRIPSDYVAGGEILVMDKNSGRILRGGVFCGVTYGYAGEKCTMDLMQIEYNCERVAIE